MKKLIVFLAASAIAVAATAQTPTATAMQKHPILTPMDRSIRSVTMKDGKVWLKEEGKATVITDDVTIGGSVVSPNGAVMLANGTKTILKEGDTIGMDGKIKANDAMPPKYPSDEMDTK